MSQAQQTSDLPIDDLRAEFDGRMVAPEDPAYDEARQVFFKGVDRRPVAVVRPTSAEEVAKVVSIARDTDLELAVRSGGHSRAGYGTTEGGIVIDLSEMKSLDIDADAKTAWVETGITAAEYTIATGERGLVTGFGDAGSVGIGGHHPRGRHRVPGPQERADDRRSARGRGGHRRRRGGRDERGQRAGPVLGDPRRRGQLRCRHALQAAAPRDLGDRRRNDDPAGHPRGAHRLPRGRRGPPRRSSRRSAT